MQSGSNVQLPAYIRLKEAVARAQAAGATVQARAAHQRSAGAAAGASGGGAPAGGGRGDGTGNSPQNPPIRPRGISPLTRNVANAARLRAELALKDANVLDANGRLTKYALEKSIPAMSKKQKIENTSVVEELTKDGSSIEDWGKFTTTEPVRLSTGQPIQVHFYRNIITGEVNYSHKDLKVKEEIAVFYGRPKPELSVNPGI